METVSSVQLILAAVFDVTFLLCILLYLFAVKMKLLLLLVIDWLIVVVSLVARIVMLVRVDISIEKILIVDWVVLGCCCIEIVLIVFTTTIWTKVPDRKWLKKFDMTHRMTIVKKPKNTVAKSKPTQLRSLSDEITEIEPKL